MPEAIIIIVLGRLAFALFLVGGYLGWWDD
jgi:hypothetical protein